MTRGRRPQRDERGFVTLWMALLMLPLFAMASLALDTGVLYAAHERLQNDVDAVVMAALKPGLEGSPPGGWLDLIRLQGAARRTTDLVEGRYNLESRIFVPGAAPGGLPAFRLTAVLEEMPLFFAPLFGQGSADVSAQAIAMRRRREIVIVQEVSAPFQAELPDARFIGHIGVQTMEDQELQEDRVGIVVFSAGAAAQTSLLDLHDFANEVRSGIDSLEACGTPMSSLPPSLCFGVDYAAGIRRAVDLFRASPRDEVLRVMVIIGAGRPCGGTVAGALAAADRAYEDEEIHIFPILLNTLGTPGCEGMNPALFHEALARGFGRASIKPSAWEVEAGVRVTLNRLPVQLVR